MHWVARQNKLELPNDEEEVNTRDIHKCDGQAHDPDTMTAPLTPSGRRGCGAHRPQTTHPSVTRMRWASAQPRGDDRPTDTQVDTKSRSPRQGAADRLNPPSTN